MKKAVVLIMVIGVMFVLTILAVVALNLMTTESRVAEHKIRRTRAYYASQAGIVDGLERLRIGDLATPAPGTGIAYCLGEQVNTYIPVVVIVSRGANFIVSTAAFPNCTNSDRTYTCDVASPSPFCVFSTVGDYSG
ncbi:MAG: hypothetical protein WC412_00690 [Candidatus Omnitrophota bacterium]|jgi:hypothetical protein